MTKKLLTLTIAAFLLVNITTLSAQSGRNCGTALYYEMQLRDQPGFAKNREKIEDFTQKFVQQHPNFRSTNGTITIPVVFHVLYSNAAQNISDARLTAQLDELNDDFSGTANNVGNTPAIWTGLVSNSGIQFCFAQRDPSGCTTNGIIRKATTVNQWGFNDNMKFDATNGDDAWPAADYLNVWVCNLGAGLLGFATFPGGAANVDGVVLLYSSVGGPASPGTANPYHLGRTGTHEVGHWLNLFHINGDSNCGNDQVSDTPTQDQLHGGCGTHPYHVNFCSGSTNGEMFMNYMDYSDDACMTMFSNGQGARMNAALQGPRSSILTSQGCVAPTSFANDAGISGIIDPSGSICASNITPVVELKNFGNNMLTSVVINYQVDAGPINTYSWSGNLADCAPAINVTLPAIAVSAGVHTFTAYTSDPNTVTDPNAANNSSNSNFNSSLSGATLPFQQGFELATFPPSNWTIDNPDGSTTWDRTTVVATTGVGSMWMDNANYPANGEIDEAIMSPVDLTTVANPELKFQVAYTYWTLPYQYSDTLEVLLSTNCGQTWTSIYKKWGNTLATAPGQSSDFFPTPSQWRLETISLAPYASAGNVIIKFRNITDYENNMFIDDINIDQATGIETVNADPSFTVYPIPANGIVNVQWGSLVKENISVTVTNSIGKTVHSNRVENYNGSVLPVDLSKQADGVYFIQVKTENKVVNHKIVLKK